MKCCGKQAALREAERDRSARDPAAQQAGDADAVLRAEALDRQVADEIEHRDQHHHQPDLVEIP